MKSILIVEDDITFGMMLKTWLTKKGFEVSSVSTIARAQKFLEMQTVDLILSDLRLPDQDGIFLLRWMNERRLVTPLIMMTGYADIQSAVQAIKLGASDYIAKPVNPDELLQKMNAAFTADLQAGGDEASPGAIGYAARPSGTTSPGSGRMGSTPSAGSSTLSRTGSTSSAASSANDRPGSTSSERSSTSGRTGSTSSEGSSASDRMGSTTPAASHANSAANSAQQAPSPDFLEGNSDAARQLYKYVELVAPTNMSVLINGASGTGKEYVAHRIHQLSKRNGKPFIAIDCGAIPKELAASEFFGHIKGAFTGALNDTTGAFVAANGGTIFLDEIGNLSYEVQVQLLRVLQERKVRPIGSNKEITVDIRLLSATNESLEAAIEKGSFREDLYHRINEFTLRIPCLKDRHEDILLFANFFLDQANKELGKQLTGFSPEATKALLDYHWPGNLRQMKNIIKRATLLAQDNYITPLELGEELKEPTVVPHLSLKNEKAEKEQILEVLRQTGNNKSKAAQLLNIDRKTLYNKLKLHGIDL